MIVTTIVQVHLVKNSEILRTNPPSSPSPSGPSTCLGVQELVTRTTPVTVIVTTLLVDRECTRHDHNYHRPCPTRSVRGPNVHRTRSLTVDITTVVQPSRVGILGSSSRVHGYYPVPLEVPVPREVQGSVVRVCDPSLLP